MTPAKIMADTSLTQSKKKPALLLLADKRRRKAMQHLVPSTKTVLGQFMTPMPVAEFMASMFADVSRKEIRLLDPGAGVGSLTASFIERICSQSNRPDSISVTAYEVDDKLATSLKRMLDDCVKVSKSCGIRMTYRLVRHDFVEAATESLGGGLFADRTLYTHVITNPPYKKIQSSSRHRKVLSRAGIEATNLYSAFIALAIKLLDKNGELVAITPRSFANGPYFLPFRRILLSESCINQIHVVEARNEAFRDDKVLQENIIYHLSKSPQSYQVLLTTSQDSNFRHFSSRQVPFSEIIRPGDKDLVIHIPAHEEDSDIVQRIKELSHSLDDLGISVSTGPVVDFRLREFIHKEISPSTVPLVYPAHFQKGAVVWPKLKGKKPNSIDDIEATRKWLLPAGHYTLTRRFSSKEEKRRVVTAIFDPTKITADWIGFENHLNVFHSQGRGLSAYLARGLALYLNSTIVDKFFRLFNGHTQVNATDLRSLPYPGKDVLIALGKKLHSSELPPQNVIDELINLVVFSRSN